MNLLFATGSRADYGLLKPLIMEAADRETAFVVALGSHLSHEFGYTIREVEKNCPGVYKIECCLSSDTPVGIAKSFSLAVSSFAEVLDRIRPDGVVLLGDRYEILACAVAAHLARVPIVHLHGGEVTEGSQDNAMRFAISHMASLHFTAAEEYRQRLIRCGQDPETVFVVGAIGCDGLTKRPERDYAKMRVVLCHYQENIEPLVREYFWSAPFNLVNLQGSHDTGCFANKGSAGMSRPAFLDLLRGADCIIGNSSSSVIEAPALGVPSILVGDRQKGRLLADSIIQAEPTKESIKAAFDRLYSSEFQAMMQADYFTPYKGGNVAERIMDILVERLPKVEMKKGFYDMEGVENGK